jgi:hypothetical protein
MHVPNALTGKRDVNRLTEGASAVRRETKVERMRPRVSGGGVNTVPRGDEEIEAKKRNPRHRARRWVVERTHSWINRFRRLLIRWEKLEANYLGLLQFACALITYRAAGVFG